MTCDICGNKNFSEETSTILRGELDPEEFQIILCPDCVKSTGILDGSMRGFSL